MTEEKNINADAEKDKFADEVLTKDELDNVAGGTGSDEFVPVRGDTNLVTSVSNTKTRVKYEYETRGK